MTSAGFWLVGGILWTLDVGLLLLRCNLFFGAAVFFGAAFFSVTLFGATFLLSARFFLLQLFFCCKVFVLVSLGSRVNCTTHPPASYNTVEMYCSQQVQTTSAILAKEITECTFLLCVVSCFMPIMYTNRIELLWSCLKTCKLVVFSTVTSAVFSMAVTECWYS